MSLIEKKVITAENMRTMLLLKLQNQIELFL